MENHESYYHCMRTGARRNMVFKLKRLWNIFSRNLEVWSPFNCKICSKLSLFTHYLK